MDLKPQSDAQKESQKQEEGVDSMEYSRDETYYFEDGNVVLLVQNRLFKVSPLCTPRCPQADVLLNTWASDTQNIIQAELHVFQHPLLAATGTRDTGRDIGRKPDHLSR
jgi:hypothetical protein